MRAEKKNCQNCKEDFTIDPEDFGFYEKMKVPPPTFCPDCRAQRRYIWRNERTMYKRKCDKCGASFIALYPEDSPYTIYCKDCWYGDGWDPMSYGAEYDSGRNFFEQFKELQQKVPRLGIWTVQCHNSPYTNQSYSNKNCYLCFAIRDSEDCTNISYAVKMKKSIDGEYVHYSENLYECFNVEKSYNSRYAEESEAAIDCAFVSDCRNIQNSCGVVNQRGSSDIFFGEKLSKDEFKKRMSALDLGDRKTVDELSQKFEKMKKEAPHKYAKLINCRNSTGDHLENARNCKAVFDGYDLENARYSVWVFSSKEIHDAYGMGSSEFIYESIGPEEVSNIKFSSVVDGSNNLEYCEMCKSSAFLFGCEGLQSKKYCILNKQYSKEDYESLKESIVMDMSKNPYVDGKGRVFSYGEFFPYDLAPYAYNETIAQRFYPLDHEKAKEAGLHWKEQGERNYSITMKNEDIPSNIKDVGDAILNEVIECAHAGKCAHGCTSAFKITQAELGFYRGNAIPLPAMCPNCRCYSRLEKKNPLKLFHRKCMREGCLNEFETTYPPENPETIYCEECYNKEVY